LPRLKSLAAMWGIGGASANSPAASYDIPVARLCIAPRCGALMIVADREDQACVKMPQEGRQIRSRLTRGNLSALLRASPQRGRVRPYLSTRYCVLSRRGMAGHVNRQSATMKKIGSRGGAETRRFFAALKPPDPERKNLGRRCHSLWRKKISAPLRLCANNMVCVLAGRWMPERVRHDGWAIDRRLSRHFLQRRHRPTASSFPRLRPASMRGILL